MLEVEKFPVEIIKSMRASRAMTTCVPVQFDGSSWESAVFFELGGDECASDREILGSSDRVFNIGLEADVIECATAAVVMLRFEVGTRAQSPLVGEVLLTPGRGSVQYETLQNLTQQNTLRFFFGDSGYHVLHAQQLALGDAEKSGYQGILDDAVKHDAMIRLTGKYDAAAALKEVTGKYAARLHS